MSLTSFIVLFVFLVPGLNLKQIKEKKRSFVIDYENNQFLKDGDPFRYISGSIHYFRSPRYYWNDRLKKAKALGLNTIQTYVAWNIHEEKEGVYDFSGEKDLIEFINIAQQNDLLVILRPGPYIDAEWEHGGLPWWLGKYKLNVRVSDDKLFSNFAIRWFYVLLEKMKPMLYENGGAVIALQVENEYGNYYACDKEYLSLLEYIIKDTLGENIVLFTTDGYTDDYLQCGTVPSLFKTIDFGTEITAIDAFKQQRKYQREGPFVNSEYYTGWLDYWGRKHQTRDGKVITTYLENILSLNASVNLYMFHGGTNFGFMNGADRDKENFLISPTSYDYDAPLSEAGDATYKYYEIRQMLQKHVAEPLPPVPSNSTKLAYGEVPLYSYIGLKALVSSYQKVFGEALQSYYPLTMEEVNVPYGFLLYHVDLPTVVSKSSSFNLHLDRVLDQSIIFVDNQRQVVVERGPVDVQLIAGKSLQIFVENQGRVAYADKGSHYLPDLKGIIGNATANGYTLTNWTMYPFNDTIFIYLQNHKVEGLDLAEENDRNEPKIYSTSLNIDILADTFIDMKNWGKGQVYINNFNVGKYWSSKGPQRTLYVPKSMLQQGENDILLFEVEKSPCSEDCFVKFTDVPILNSTP